MSDKLIYIPLRMTAAQADALESILIDVKLDRARRHTPDSIDAVKIALDAIDSSELYAKPARKT